MKIVDYIQQSRKDVGMKKYPFFLIIDDGGVDAIVHDGNTEQVSMVVYNTVLKIAKQFNMRIRHPSR